MNFVVIFSLLCRRLDGFQIFNPLFGSTLVTWLRIWFSETNKKDNAVTDLLSLLIPWCIYVSKVSPKICTFDENYKREFFKKVFLIKLHFDRINFPVPYFSRRHFDDIYKCFKTKEKETNVTSSPRLFLPKKQKWKNTYDTLIREFRTY